MSVYQVFMPGYSIGTDVYREVPKVCGLYGEKAMVIGGKKAMAVALGRLKEAISGSMLSIVAEELYGDDAIYDCTYGNIHRLAAIAKSCGAQMIFGMGGGRALDTAKGAAFEAGLPIFTFPTIASTCSPITKLSVVYRDDHSFDSFYNYPAPPVHSFIELSIIAAAPFTYIQAGIGDTIGKKFECQLSCRGEVLRHWNAMGREISNLCYEPLLQYGVQALEDNKKGIVSEALQEVVMAIIISTGMVSLHVEDDYNGAIAHAIYYSLCILPEFESKWLHGNVVAYGVLVQLAVDGDREEILRLKAFLEKLGVITKLSRMDVSMKREDMEPVLDLVFEQSDMDHLPYPVDKDMIYRAMLEIEEL